MQRDEDNYREMSNEEFLHKHMMKLTTEQLKDLAALLRYTVHNGLESSQNIAVNAKGEIIVEREHA